MQREILARLASHFEMRLRLDEGKAAVWGGVVTGALAGLKADLLSGGLTLGGGLLAGGLLGALGGAGVARCVNLVRGTGQSWLAWNAEALNQIVEAALLRYLAVAHFGRGRGEWAQGETPPHWKDVVDDALGPAPRGARCAVGEPWWPRQAADQRGRGGRDRDRAAAAVAPGGERGAAPALPRCEGDSRPRCRGRVGRRR